MKVGGEERAELSVSGLLRAGEASRPVGASDLVHGDSVLHY